MNHIFENLPTGIVVVEGDELTVNHAVETITGYARSELTDIDRWFELLYRENAKLIRGRYESRKAARDPGARILTMYRKTGEIRYVEITAYFDEVAEYWALNDITEQMTLQRRFQLVFECSSDGLVILEDKEGQPKLVEGNPAAYRTLGVSTADQIVGLSIDHFIPNPADQARVDEVMRNAKAEGSFSADFPPIEFEARRLDGTLVPVALRVRPLEAKDKTLLLTTWRDLTAEHMARAQLIQNSKMVSLGEMSSGLAHEMNTPLAVIKARAQQLGLGARRGSLTPELLREGLEKIEGTVARMSNIVTGLRSFARESSRDADVPTSLKQIIDDTLAFCETRLKNLDISVHQHVEAEIRVLCRSSQISQVLLNLIHNASDALEPVRDRWIEIAATRENGQVLVRVRDGGPGVPSELRDRIMQPFFTTKAVGRGTGLGLSVSSGIIAAHGGKLRLDADDPHTCFVFDLRSGDE